jgi:hypothetical protein
MAAVVILGAGVMGASVAWHLTSHGCRDVLLLDRGAAPGAGSTSRATGGFRAQYATAIKGADPAAKVFGPVTWGYCDLFSSAADGCHVGADRNAHGGLPFVQWYLRQVCTHAQQTGTRLVDYLDLHYYPQGSDVVDFTDGTPGASENAANSAKRLRSLKELYDPAWVAESWFADLGDFLVRVVVVKPFRHGLARGEPVFVSAMQAEVKQAGIRDFIHGRKDHEIPALRFIEEYQRDPALTEESQCIRLALVLEPVPISQLNGDLQPREESDDILQFG